MKEREETMVVKITGAVFIVLCGAFAGLYRSKILQKQAEYIEQYISFLTQAQAMISYSYANITEILENVNSVPLMNLMIKQCRGKMKNGDDFERAWSSAVFGSYQRGEITKADHEMICRFSEGFGSLGAEEESAKIKLCLSDAQRRYDKLNAELTEKRKLYGVVGTFCGVLAAVILI